MPVTDLTVSGSPELKTKKSPENTQNAETRPQKVGFVSLGCPKNLVDSEVMMGMLARAGAELTRRAEDADIIVVNTCSFINSAQQESVNTILEMAGHKAAGRAKKLVVAGCLVERYRDQIRKDIPEVDAVVGTGELVNILSATGIAAQPQPNSPFVVLNSRPEGDARVAQGRFSRETWDGAIADLPNYLYDEDTPRILATPRHMIERHGAVSREVAAALAEGIRYRCESTLGVGITGVAGPGGGSTEKPVGLVFHAVASDSGTEVIQRNYPGDRKRIRRFASTMALDMVRRKLM